MRDILFVGGVLASVTHEMQNVMAIIKESGALAGDILEINGIARLKHADKLENALGNIEEQVDRGRNLMLMLNGFAHAASDFPQCGDLSRLARQMAVLGERMVKLKECALVTHISAKTLHVKGNAVLLMQSVYLGMRLVLDGMTAGGELRLSLPAIQGGPGGPGETGESGESGEVDEPALGIFGVASGFCAPEQGGEARDEALGALRALMREVHGRLEYTDKGLRLVYAPASVLGERPL